MASSPPVLHLILGGFEKDDIVAEMGDKRARLECLLDDTLAHTSLLLFFSLPFQIPLNSLPGMDGIIEGSQILIGRHRNMEAEEIKISHDNSKNAMGSKFCNWAWKIQATSYFWLCLN